MLDTQERALEGYLVGSEGPCFSASSAGQEPVHAHADALLFGQIPQQPAHGEVENAETEGAEDRHVLRTVPRPSCAKEDIGQGAANKRPATGLLLGQMYRGLRPTDVIDVVHDVV